MVIHGYFKNQVSLPNVVPGTAGATHGVASRDPGLSRRERQYSFSNVALNDIAPNMAFCRQIVIMVIHGYFKNGASLPNVVPSTATPMHGVASSDPRLNRRERRKSFSKVDIDDAVFLQ
jgi:hypothetical protein